MLGNMPLDGTCIWLMMQTMLLAMGSVPLPGKCIVASGAKKAAAEKFMKIAGRKGGKCSLASVQNLLGRLCKMLEEGMNYDAVVLEQREEAERKRQRERPDNERTASIMALMTKSGLCCSRSLSTKRTTKRSCSSCLRCEPTRGGRRPVASVDRSPIRT